ncbi:MAG: DNA cytosine methyltransferase, partial [Ureaplasma sp.]|nr:DNA cytosine methyltransferase [Ureaplasma sp.]
DKFEKIGYYSNYILLDSSNFGVPQKRERVIFIGAKKQNKKKVDNVINKLSKHTEKIVTVKEAIFDLKDKDENLEFNHIFTKHSPEMIEKIINTKIGKSAMKNFSDAWRKLDYNKPSFTVKENHGGVHIHPELPRVLTPRELARLQSFPDDFIFLGSKSEILKQIGNAVPCKLSLEIAKIIKKEFFKE